jgi:hypothetical protein
MRITCLRLLLISFLLVPCLAQPPPHVLSRRAHLHGWWGSMASCRWPLKPVFCASALAPSGPLVYNPLAEVLIGLRRFC